jgi:hypothetical protein
MSEYFKRLVETDPSVLSWSHYHYNRSFQQLVDSLDKKQPKGLLLALQRLDKHREDLSEVHTISPIAELRASGHLINMNANFSGRPLKINHPLKTIPELPKSNMHPIDCLHHAIRKKVECDTIDDMKM